MICATKWNFRSCFEKVYRSYCSPFISVAKEGAGNDKFFTSKIAERQGSDAIDLHESYESLYGLCESQN